MQISVKGPKDTHRLYTERSAKNLWNFQGANWSKESPIDRTPLDTVTGLREL